MTLRFWFIHDTDTCHHTGLKLGRRSETGREKRVTPEFGERKEEKNSTPEFRALQYARVKCYICRVIGDPQLGINRFGPLLLRHEDLVTALHVAF
jgi:hypothetical protein